MESVPPSSIGSFSSWPLKLSSVTYRIVAWLLAMQGLEAWPYEKVGNYHVLPADWPRKDGQHHNLTMFNHNFPVINSKYGLIEVKLWLTWLNYVYCRLIRNQ